MKLSLTKELHKAFPNLYSRPVGFDCGDGWLNLLVRLSTQLEPLIIQYKIDYPGQPAPQVSQVKEKYGTLRFYMDCATDEMWDYIEEAESRSHHICEICGAERKSIKPREIKGWVVTYCWKHALKRCLKRTLKMGDWTSI